MNSECVCLLAGDNRQRMLSPQALVHMHAPATIQLSDYCGHIAIYVLETATGAAQLATRLYLKLCDFAYASSQCVVVPAIWILLYRF